MVTNAISRIQSVPSSTKGGRVYERNKPTPSTMPGTATGAVARNASARQPAIALRAVRYEITTAMTVPMVAERKPRMNVFLNASLVDESSKNTNSMLCSVKLLNETNCEAV